MLVIGIAGGTASGKTYLVNELKKEFKEEGMSIICQDNYYHSNDHLTYEQRRSLNYDHPDAVDFELLTQHVLQLKKNKPIEQPVYAFQKHTRAKKTCNIRPSDLLVLEGTLVLSLPELRNLMDVKIFVDADADERLIRRIHRDVKERGRSVEAITNRYRNTLKPMHTRFVAPQKKLADAVILNTNKEARALQKLRETIRKKQLLI